MWGERRQEIGSKSLISSGLSYYGANGARWLYLTENHGVDGKIPSLGTMQIQQNKSFALSDGIEGACMPLAWAVAGLCEVASRSL